MRPFKMFFALSIGILLFFFIAKVLIIAFIAAAILTLIFGAVRRLKYRSREFYETEPPLFYDDYKSYDSLVDVHYIKVH